MRFAEPGSGLAFCAARQRGVDPSFSAPINAMECNKETQDAGPDPMDLTPWVFLRRRRLDATLYFPRKVQSENAGRKDRPRRS